MTTTATAFGYVIAEDSELIGASFGGALDDYVGRLSDAEYEALALLTRVESEVEA